MLRQVNDVLIPIPTVERHVSLNGSMYETISDRLVVRPIVQQVDKHHLLRIRDDLSTNLFIKLFRQPREFGFDSWQRVPLFLDFFIFDEITFYIL